MRLRLLLVLIYFLGSSLRGKNIANNFLQRSTFVWWWWCVCLFCLFGVVAVVTVEDFYNFAQGLLKSSSRFAMERNAGIGYACSKVVAANRAHFCGLHFLRTTRRKFCGRVIPRVCESIST
jgi:hypothetical protein